MPDLLAYLIQNCLHDSKGDFQIDISSKDLEGKFEPSQVACLKEQGLLEAAPVPIFLRCSECGRSCTAEIIRDSGRYFVFCEDYSSRRLLETEEIERWRLSLTGLGRFIADDLRSVFVNTPTDNGIEVCIRGGYEYFLEKDKTNWILRVESARILLSELFLWKDKRYQINSSKLKQSLERLVGYKVPKTRWTKAKLQELIDRKTALQRSGERAFLKALASEYGVSSTAIQKALNKAKEKGMREQLASPFKI